MSSEFIDLLEKLEIAKLAMEKVDKSEIFDVLFPEESFVESSVAMYIQNEKKQTRMKKIQHYKYNLKKWENGTKPSVAYTKELAEQLKKILLKKSSILTVNKIITSTVSEFYELLDQSFKEVVYQDASEDLKDKISNGKSSVSIETNKTVESVRKIHQITPKAVGGRFASGLHFVPVILDDYIKLDITRALRAGRIDQKFLYCDPLAVKNWSELTSSSAAVALYPTYQICHEALKSFISSDDWKDFISEGLVGGVFILGAGAADKDIVILNSFVDYENMYSEPRQLEYIIIDSSMYMLMDTVKEMEGKGGHILESVEIITSVADFMKMERFIKTYRGCNKGKRSAFFILGGTISNLNEDKFIRSIANAACPGDMLIIGVEFVGDNVNEYKLELERKYNHKFIRDFYVPHVRSVIDHVNKEKHGSKSKSSKDAEDCINIYIDDTGKFSKVNKSISAIVEASIDDDRKLTMLTANRYDKKEFTDFVENRGFELLGLWSSDRYKQYNQAVFIRK